MFTLSARYYDLIYGFKDYRGEAEKLAKIVQEKGRSSGRSLLDVACGSGHHLEYLVEWFVVEGLDLAPDLLELARERLPGVPFHQADMADFALERQFDVISCLFSSIGYLKTLERVRQAVECWVKHLTPGGVLLIEPWFTPENWHPGSVHALLVDQPELKIARLSTSMVEGRLSYFDFHYLVATSAGTEHFVERHEMGLFETEEQLEILTQAGLQAEYDPDGLTGRGLLIGRKVL
jgi:trans-aconitate methyltransferase